MFPNKIDNPQNKYNNTMAGTNRATTCPILRMPPKITADIIIAIRNEHKTLNEIKERLQNNKK